MDISKIFFSILSFVSGFLITPGTKNVSSISPTPGSETSLTIVEKQISIENTSFAYAVIGPVSPQDVTLTSNLSKKESSSDLKERHACTYLVNGGFYGKNDRHIGLFLSNERIVEPQIDHSLFNGVMTISSSGTPFIGTELPPNALMVGLQSGPLLIEHSEEKTLKISPDQSARRILAGVDDKNKFYFFSVFSVTNKFDGPTLTELPSLLSRIINEEKIVLTDAINLDGGNHSAFYGDSITLSELSPIGSFFCVK